MKILIIEAYTAANIGSGALVENSVQLLRNCFPSAEIEIFAQNPASVAKLSGLPTHHELITLPLKKPRLEQLFWLMHTSAWMAMQSLALAAKRVRINLPESLYTFDANKRNALRKIKDADMIVSIGAERINDNFKEAILFSLFMLWISKKYNKHLVLFPQTVGPFHYRITKYLSSHVLNGCNVIFLRDAKSYDIVKEIGVDRSVIVPTCDVAVLQPSVSQEEARRLLHEADHIEEGTPLVGISAMKWSHFKSTGKSGYEEYKKALALTADYLIESKGAQVLFLATNVLADGCREDDVAAANDIIRLMVHKEKAHLLSDLYSPSQMKGLMSLLDLCIVTRMHACIFATGIYTPTVSINYQFKLHEYMKLMGLGDYTIDIDDVTYGDLKEKVERAWNNLPGMRMVLHDRVEYWKQNLRKAMENLPSYYQGKGFSC